MKFKKAVSITLCAAMAVGMLTGCGLASDTASNTEETKAVDNTAAGDGSGDEKIVLKFSSWAASDLEAQAIQKAIDGFEKEYPNITVQYDVINENDYSGKLLTGMQAGEAPDVFYLNPEYVSDFASAGQLFDITDMVGENLDFDDYLPSSQEKMSYIDPETGEKKIYGIDCCIVGPVLFYNKDLFDKAGVEYPPTSKDEQWTWDEFVENMKKLTIVDKNGKTTQYGTCNFEESWSLYTTQELLLSNGVTLFNDDYSEATGFTSDKAKETMQMIKSLRTEAGVAPNPTAVGMDTGNSPTQLFETGQVATLYMGSYGLQELAATDINLGAGLPPALDNGTVPIGSANLDCIWSQTQYPEEAFNLVTYLTDTDTCKDIYASGLWMPNKKSMYEQENLSSWYNEDVYPEGWSDMFWLWKDAELRPMDHMHNVDEIYDTCTQYMEDYLYNDADLDETMQDWQDAINDILSE